MKNASKQCPSCGAPLIFKNNERTCRCEYCGNQVRAVEFAFSISRTDETPAEIVSGADFITNGTILVEYIGENNNVTVPNGITEIAPQAFSNTLIESVELPTSLSKIGWSAFEGCHYLESIAIPEGIETVESETFKDCYGLERAQLPSTLTEIGDGAFENSGLEAIVIPEHVSKIGFGAFSFCDSLESVSLPSSITHLYEIDGVFDGCSSLEQINCCIYFKNYEVWEVSEAFGDPPAMEEISKRCQRCECCEDDAGLYGGCFYCIWDN